MNGFSLHIEPPSYELNVTLSWLQVLWQWFRSPVVYQNQNLSIHGKPFVVFYKYPKNIVINSTHFYYDTNPMVTFYCNTVKHMLVDIFIWHYWRYKQTSWLPSKKESKTWGRNYQLNVSALLRMNLIT